MGKKKRDPDVEVERMPNLDGWEYFKAMDLASTSERWTLALLHEPDGKKVDYALWTDLKKDPEATGTLDARKGEDASWALAVRRAVKTSDEGDLDDAAREELVLAVLAKHDPTLDDYQDRLLFALEAPAGDDEEDGEADDDSDDDDDDDGEDSEDDDDDG